MTKPTDLGLWATNSLVENIGDNSFVNKVKPSQGFIDDGVKALEPWSRAFLNYQFNLAGLWHEWLDQSLYPVGSQQMLADGIDPAVIYGMGTWSLFHTDTLNGTNVNYWERTA